MSAARVFQRAPPVVAIAFDEKWARPSRPGRDFTSSCLVVHAKSLISYHRHSSRSFWSIIAEVPYRLAQRIISQWSMSDSNIDSEVEKELEAGGNGVPNDGEAEDISLAFGDDIDPDLASDVGSAQLGEDGSEDPVRTELYSR